jgi:transcriptional regulator with XRE-family HTH domain
MGRANFGSVLRRLRHGRDETLEQVSGATGLSVAMLSRVERGERLPSPESVEALARHFELPVDYLMSETIANRMVNRYGEESTSRAAEHLSREAVDLDIIAGARGDPAKCAGAEEAAGTYRGPSPSAPRAYGPFREMDILAALSSPEPARRKPRDETPSEAPMPVPAAYYTAAKAIVTPTEQPLAEIDPATARVLRAATEASEAAAVLVLREAPSLSREARLEVIERLGTLAGHAFDVLRMLASDPDQRVRAAARQRLEHLTRG